MSPADRPLEPPVNNAGYGLRASGYGQDSKRSSRSPKPGARSRFLRSLQPCGQRRNRWRLEELPERNSSADGVLDARDHLHGQHRIPAKLEEVVLDAHTREPERLGPDPGK